MVLRTIHADRGKDQREGGQGGKTSNSIKEGTSLVTCPLESRVDFARTRPGSEGGWGDGELGNRARVARDATGVLGRVCQSPRAFTRILQDSAKIRWAKKIKKPKKRKKDKRTRRRTPDFNDRAIIRNSPPGKSKIEKRIRKPACKSAPDAWDASRSAKQKRERGRHTCTDDDLQIPRIRLHLKYQKKRKE